MMFSVYGVSSLSQSLVLDQALRQSAHTSEKQGTNFAPANLSAKEKHKIASVQKRLGPQLEVEECMASRRARIPAGASALLILIEGSSLMGV